MKKYLLLLCLLSPVTAFALSCPTNGSIIEQGDSLQEVMQRCGMPAIQNSYTQDLPVTHQWSRHEGDMTYKHAVTYTHSVAVIELAYNGSRLSPNTLKFENGKLVSWE